MNTVWRINLEIAVIKQSIPWSRRVGTSVQVVEIRSGVRFSTWILAQWRNDDGHDHDVAMHFFELFDPTEAFVQWYTTLFVETKGLTTSLPLARLHPRGAFDHPSVAHQRVHLSFLIAIAPRQIMIALISFPSRLPRPWLRYAPFQQPMRAKGADTRGDKPPPSFFTSNSSHRLCVNNRVFEINPRNVEISHGAIRE